METMILAFNIGRKYNGQKNQGSTQFLGKNKIGDFIESYNLFYEEDEDMYYDEGGNSVGLTGFDVEFGVGEIDYDGSYDTTYTKKIDTHSEVKDPVEREMLLQSELSDDEWNAILWSEDYDAEDLREELNIKERHSWKS